jgi:hypothetical protein
MAATNVYARLTRIPWDEGPHGTGQAVETINALSNANTTSSPFRLNGGLFEIEVQADTFGTVTLQKLGPDGSSYLTQATAFSATGTALAYCAFGTYRFAVA